MATREELLRRWWRLEKEVMKQQGRINKLVRLPEELEEGKEVPQLFDPKDLSEITEAMDKREKSLREASEAFQQLLKAQEGEP